jgi:hypothetical protein
MARNFRDFNEDISPTSLKLPNGFGVRFMQGFIGYFADLTAEAAAQATKCGWVRVSTSPADALPSIGLNFNIPQAPGELDSEFRSRLSDDPGAWTLWEESATGDFAENALAPFGFDASDVELFTRNEWSLIRYSDSWSRFWIVVDPTGIWDEDIWGVGNWADAGTWGSGATQVHIGGIIDLILKWKSGHEVGHSVILDYDGHIWGAAPTWGAPRTWGISGVVRWPLTRFWDEESRWGEIDAYRTSLGRVWGGKIEF